MSLQGKYAKQYRSKKSGNLVFVYEVKGSEKELEHYEECQGEHYKEDPDTGTALFFTTRFAGKACKFLITESNKVFVDNSEMDQMGSLIEQAGSGPLGMAMANIAAARLLGTEPVTQQAIAQAAPIAQADPAPAGADGGADPDDIEGI